MAFSWSTRREAMVVAKALHGCCDFPEGSLHPRHAPALAAHRGSAAFDTEPSGVSKQEDYQRSAASDESPVVVDLRGAELARLLVLEEEAYFASKAPATTLLARDVPCSPGRVSKQDYQRRAAADESPIVVDLRGAELARLLVLEEESYFASKAPQATTLMVRNVPYVLTGDEVRAQLLRLGFDGAYDFFYLPRFRKSRANQGFFFVNLKTAEGAAAFRERLQGEPLGSSGAKLCDVILAEWQGLRELREHFRKKSVMRSEHRPLFL